MSDYLEMVEDDFTQLHMGGSNYGVKNINDVKENNSNYLQLVEDNFNNLKVKKSCTGQHNDDIVIPNIQLNVNNSREKGRSWLNQ